jgi:hypothetical protein
MTRTFLRHPLTALPMLMLASAFASTPASTQGVWDNYERPRGNLFSPNQAGQVSSSQTPSMSRPSSARNQGRSNSPSPDVQKELSLTDDQK